MENSFYFFSPVDEKEIQREKQKARKLRKSRWWQRKCSEGVCYYCGKQADPASLTMDHVVPLARGGRSTKDNLVPACKECNSKKKYLLPMEWEDYVNPKT